MRITNFRMNLLYFFAGICMVGFLACAQNTTRPHSETKHESQRPDLVHTVRYPGETLALIANWYTKSSSNWKAIQSANPGLEPTRMYIGQTIFIPIALVVEDRAMPQSILTSKSSSKSEESKKINKATTEKVEAVAEVTTPDISAVEVSTPESEPDNAVQVSPPVVEEAEQLTETPEVVTENVQQEVGKTLGELEKQPTPVEPMTQSEKDREQLLQELLSE